MNSGKIYSPTKKDSSKSNIEDRNKSIYLPSKRYDLYVASKLIKNPNADKEEDVENKFFFPLHRIKSIMKQDKFYAPKT